MKESLILAFKKLIFSLGKSKSLMSQYKSSNGSKSSEYSSLSGGIALISNTAKKHQEHSFLVSFPI